MIGSQPVLLRNVDRRLGYIYTKASHQRLRHICEQARIKTRVNTGKALRCINSRIVEHDIVLCSCLQPLFQTEVINELLIRGGLFTDKRGSRWCRRVP